MLLHHVHDYGFVDYLSWLSQMHYNFKCCFFSAILRYKQSKFIDLIDKKYSTREEGMKWVLLGLQRLTVRWEGRTSTSSEENQWVVLIFDCWNCLEQSRLPAVYRFEYSVYLLEVRDNKKIPEFHFSNLKATVHFIEFRELAKL